MKINYIIICFLLSLASCNSRKKQNIKTEYEPLAGISYPMELDEKKYYDSICISETEAAKNDVKSNKFVYTHLLGMVEYHRSNKEIDSLLSTYSIRTREILYYCTVPWSKQNCYGKIMETEISKKYGNNFIDSLRNVAEKIYVKKHQNDIFNYEDCDMQPRYGKSINYSKSMEKIKKDFWKSTDYPVDFEFRKEKEKHSWMNAYFILYKDGSISEPEIEINFNNDKNYLYSSYFIQQLENFVKKSKWKPATSSGIPVNSNMEVLIFFK